MGGGKGKVIDVLAPILGAMDPFDYDRYTNQIAVEIKANLGSVKKSIQANLKKPKFYDRTNQDQYPQEPQEVDEELRSEKRDSLSDHVLAQMFAWPELFELLSDVDTDVFEKTEDKQIFAKWKEFISFYENYIKH